MTVSLYNIYIIFIPEAVPLYLLYALSGKLEGTRR